MSRRSGTLTQSLDREVYQVVRKIIDEDDQLDVRRVSASIIYDTIRHSNSSLNRKNKRLLEGSIDRVLTSIVEDLDDSSGIDTESPREAPTAPDNRLNRSIVGLWSTSQSTPQPDKMSTRETATSKMASQRQVNGEPPAKKRKGVSGPVDTSYPTHVSMADLGGVESVIQQLEDLLLVPMKQPEMLATHHIQPPRGILLHGPPGCGKTMIANAIAAELRVSFISISAPSIVSGMSGESEKALRDHFEQARKVAPCLVFIDEIDAITPKRDGAQREMEKRIVAQLLTCLDDLALEKTDGKPVIVLAATNRPDSLDPALRRGGRFDKEINIGVPSEPVREKILRTLTREMVLADDVDFPSLAKRTPGYVGADLNDLVSTAAGLPVKRYIKEIKASTSTDTVMLGTNSISNEPHPSVIALRKMVSYFESPQAGPNTTNTDTLKITQSDFLTALPQVQPSALREGFATIPSTTFADIGALTEHRAELTLTIINAILHPERYARFGITSPPGLLLWGPPGCGKTLLARAIANESRANFISVKGPELLNKYVGESERAVRQLFARARSSVPVIIFFDELDALVPRRGDSSGSAGGTESTSRVVNTLLTELDGIDKKSKEGIYVIAATNRPDIIDPAMLRPGRLDTTLYVGLPSPEERVEVMKALCAREKTVFGPNMTIDGSAGGKEVNAAAPALTSALVSNINTNQTGATTPPIPSLPLALTTLLLSPALSGYSGADLESLLRRAGYVAMRRGAEYHELRDFIQAAGELSRSVSEEEMRRFEGLRKVWRR